MPLWNKESPYVPFGSFAPDKDPLTPGILLAMTNAVPTLAGYIPIKAGVAKSNPLIREPMGATVALFSDGTQRTVAATANHLYALQSGSWVQVDGGQSFTATERWRFAQFGDDLLAFSKGQIPQFALGSSGTFAPLGGSPVHAGLVVSVAAFVLVADGIFWYNSAAGTDDNWVPSAQTLSATGALYQTPGPITALAPLLKNVVAFKHKSMYLGQFAGVPTVWNFDLISTQKGTWGQEMVIGLGDALAFIGPDDFYISNGYAPQPIPDSPIKWFLSTVNMARIAETIGWYDDEHAVLWWMFPSKVSLAGQLDSYVAYNRRAQRWAAGLFLCTFIPYPQTTDFKNPLAPGFFDTSFILKENSGDSLPMQLTTGFMGVTDRLSQLLKVRTHYNADQYPDTERLYPFHTPQLGKAVISSTPGILSGDGWFNMRQTNWYHRVLLSTTGANEATGLSWSIREAGRR